MRILAIERPVEGVADARFTPEIREAEARRAWDLHQAGVIRELYFHADEAMAVLILRVRERRGSRRRVGISADGLGRPDRVRGAAAARLPRLRAALYAYF